MLKTGTVKVWKPEKGFGFLAPDDPRDSDIFFHISTLQKAGIQNVQPGDRLSYEEGIRRQGKPQAVSVAVA